MKGSLEGRNGKGQDEKVKGKNKEGLLARRSEENIQAQQCFHQGFAGVYEGCDGGPLLLKDTKVEEIKDGIPRRA